MVRLLKGIPEREAHLFPLYNFSVCHKAEAVFPARVLLNRVQLKPLSLPHSETRRPVSVPPRAQGLFALRASLTPAQPGFHNDIPHAHRESF